MRHWKQSSKLIVRAFTYFVGLAFATGVMLAGALPALGEGEMHAQDVTEYNLWVGGVRVTSENADDITNGSHISNGHAVYDAASHTLSFEGNLVITGSDYHQSLDGQNLGNVGVFTTESLTITGHAIISGSNMQCAIAADGNSTTLAIEGDDTGIEVSGTKCGIDHWGSGSVLLKGKVSAEGAESYGVYSGGNITIDGVDVSARCTNESSVFTGYGMGVNPNNGTVTVLRGSLTASGYSSGIYAPHISIEGGTVNVSGTSYGLCAAHENSTAGDQPSTIEVSGGTVTAEASDGQAIYSVAQGSHPGSVTLSGGSVIARGEGVSGTGIYSSSLAIGAEVIAYGAKEGIHADNGLRVSSGANISATQSDSSSSSVLRIIGPLIMGGGSLQATGNISAISVSGAATISDGTITATCTNAGGQAGDAISAMSVNVSGGTINATSDENDTSDISCGIRAFGEPDSTSDASVVISDGVVNATGYEYGIWSNGVFVDNGDAVITAEATKADGSAICSNAAKDYQISYGIAMGIVTPAGGKLSSDNKQICQSDGTTIAKSTVIKAPGIKYSIKVNGGNAMDTAYKTITSALPTTTVKVTYDAAEEGYHFKDWTFVKGISSFDLGDRTFMMPAEAVELTANFEPNTFVVATKASGDFVYNGKKQVASPVVKDGDDVLKEGRDYTVSYEKNGSAVASPIEVGTYAVFVTGKSDYKTMPKTAAGSFTISPAPEPVITKCTVSFAAGGGSGSMASVKVDKGSQYTLPACEFTAPEGKEFDKWDKGVPGTKITVTADTKLTAQWKDKAKPGPDPKPDPKPEPQPDPKPDSVTMYRVYNPNSGEHFYTSDAVEREGLIDLGWRDEEIGWMAPETSSKPVYRLYNAVGGEHHYTLDASEREYLISLGWNDEGIGWYSDDAQGQVLYREYNPNAFANNHNYTISKGEHDYLISLGWNDEGTAWYGVAVS